MKPSTCRIRQIRLLRNWSAVMRTLLSGHRRRCRLRSEKTCGTGKAKFWTGSNPDRFRTDCDTMSTWWIWTVCCSFSAMVSRSASTRQKPENIFRTRLSSSPAIPMGRIHIFLRNGPTRCGKDMNTKPSRCTSISRLHILFQRNVRLFI